MLAGEHYEIILEMLLKCTNCGHEIVPGSEFCGNCGAKLITNTPATSSVAASASPATSQPPSNAAPMPTSTVPTPQVGAVGPQPVSYAQPPGAAYAVPTKAGNGKAIASLVLGILSAVTFLIWFLSVPLGICAFIFGLLGRKGSKGMAIAGIILGVVGVIASITITIIAVKHLCKNTDGQTDCNTKTSTLIQFPAFDN